MISNASHDVIASTLKHFYWCDRNRNFSE